MQVSFFGAARNVTGSKHLIESNGFKLLLDCGLYQGRRSEANRLNRDLLFDAKTINAVILSHAHVDHCGLLPILVKQGFKGKIFCTPATMEIAKYILEDSARIQEHDCAYLNSHLSPEAPSLDPLYTVEDVYNVFPYFTAIPYFRQSKEWTHLNADISFKFYDAGHILGSAVTVVKIKEAGEFKTLAYTGDLGHGYIPILRNPEKVEDQVDTLLIETTYGDRVHAPVEDASRKILELVLRAVKKKSKIIIPAFSLGRTQEIVYLLHKMIDQGKMPTLPIYVDSPLSTAISSVFDRYEEDFNITAWQDFISRKDSPFEFRQLHYVSDAHESMQLNHLSGPLIIISASGMAEAGRVLDHLKNNIENPANAVLITGYQAENTLGRRILNGEKKVRIYDRYYNLRAKVEALNELSAHADRNGLINYLASMKGLRKVFLVHGELPATEHFKNLVLKHFPNLKVDIPELGESIVIF